MSSRYIVNRDPRELMTEADIKIILECAKDFKEFIRVSGMTHLRISPYYPQSRKIERWHKSLKGESASVRERRCR